MGVNFSSVNVVTHLSVIVVHFSPVTNVFRNYVMIVQINTMTKIRFW